MSDVGADEENDYQTIEDDNSHLACYVFEPPSNDDLDPESPTRKRRKTKHLNENATTTFPLLNHGAETEDFAQLRYDAYRKVWEKQRARIESLVLEIDKVAMVHIRDFVDHPKSRSPRKLPACLLASGPGGGAQSRLLQRWHDEQDTKASTALVQLRASHCTHLQTTLKNIIKTTIVSRIGWFGYQEFLNKHKRLIPMNFDLELLEIFTKQHGVSRIILSILDVETFDVAVLSELLSLLASYSETIPVAAVLGIATTVSLFESRLSKATIDVLEATTLKLPPSEKLYDQILDDMTQGLGQQIRLGPATISSLTELAQSQSVTIDSFTMAIKFAYMSHFFANSLSVLLSDSQTLRGEQNLCTAIRNTESFQRHCEALMTSKDKSASKMVTMLLNSDESLFNASIEALEESPTEPSFLSEATVINSRALLHPFTARPRHVLERALSKPIDYLGCDCCQSSSGASTAPSTSILYTLLQEAGTVINVRDLYDAFYTRAFPHVSHDVTQTAGSGLDCEEEMIDDITDSADSNRGQSMSLFYTSLAELKMLGFVKSNTSTLVKKRAMASAGGVDEMMNNGAVGLTRGRDAHNDVSFIAKTSWADL